MKQIKTIVLLFLISFLPLQLWGATEESAAGGLNISEIVLEHLSDNYEWHIASYKGKSLSIPLPIIVRSSATGTWSVCTAETLPKPFFFDAAHHGKIYEQMPNGSHVRPLDLYYCASLVTVLVGTSIMMKSRERREALSVQ